MAEPYIANGFICITDREGCRHALRLNSISALSDANVERTETVIIANGGRTSVMVPNSLDDLLEGVLDVAQGAPLRR